VPVFVDTNVVVYAFGQNPAKVEKAEAILANQPTISVQVINEFLSVCRVKLGFDTATRPRLAGELLAGCNVVALDSRVVEKAMEIESQSGISYWDALIVAAAVLSGCETLYSEDLQHLHVFDGRLTVVNPFA
jgi:predicted nucleic acid-binding protein